MLTLLAPGSRILDYGCGYGRLAGELSRRGFNAVEGVNLSAELITEARKQWPGLRFSVIDTPPRLPHPGESFDAVLLFAALTCVPTGSGQRKLVAELRRLLRGGGLLFLSDLCIQSDPRNRARCKRFAEKYGVYGVFETGDGAVCRHHERNWLLRLLTGFEQVAERRIPAEIMNGRPVWITQLLLRKVAR